MRALQGRRAHPRRGRGQSSIEYVLLTVLAAAALASMFSYIRSAASHRFKSGADSMGHGLLYPP